MSEIVSFIQSLDLPAAMYRRGAEQEPLPAYNSVAQAVTVGSQMTEFTKDVPQSIRPGISNGLLLGQLAADKASAKNPDPLAWFTTFNTVLRGIGWQSTLSELNEQSISHKNISLSQAIIPIVTEIVGAAAAAGSIIISVLKGLETMDQDAPWITVFERRSNKVSANNFGLSFVEGGAGGGASLKTVYFSLIGAQMVTQVLFFKFASSDAKLKSAQSLMTLSAHTITLSESALEQKVAPFIAENIKNIDI